MPTLKLSLLGPFQASIDEHPVRGFESSRVRALLAYLAVENNHPHSRDSLAGLFWPESPDQTARKNLRQALSNLRKAIADQDAEPPYLQITRESAQFRPNSKHYLDVADFRDLIDTVDGHQHRRLESCRYCAEKMKQGLNLYKGEFLQGFFLDDSVAFQDWMLLKREGYHRQVVQSLTVLTQFYEQRGRNELAQQCAYLQVELDPWREAGHQHLMRLLALEGERSAALKQYETCRDLLASELGVEPSPETTQLYEQIKANRLRADMQDKPKHNLPFQATSFVGRNNELHDLLALLSDQRNRLVTLVGPGGVGKTRLVLQAAYESTYDFRDGVCFVPLFLIHSGELLTAAIAEALGFTFQGREQPANQLINYLCQKEILLVLDNYEHLIDEQDFVVQILRQAPDVFLLISSREPLGLQAELLLNLGGLPISEHDLIPGVGLSDALELFQDRAQRVNPEFFLDESNVQYVMGICQLVDGSPLAIELAASLVRQWNCAEIEAEIQKSLDALATSMRDMPERHRSLRATFERSWGMLSPQEQGIFEKLAVFRGGFTTDAAREIAQAGMADLAALIDKSLLQRSSNGRFDLHPLIEQYVREKLGQDSHEEDSTFERFGAYFAGILQDAESKLKSRQQPEYLDAIGQDFENIRSAWHWCLQNKHIDFLNQSLEALYLFFEGRSRYQEGVTLLGGSLAALEGNKKGIYWRVCVRYGALSYRLGDYDKAKGIIDQCLGAFQQSRNRKEESFTHYASGNVAYLRGNFKAAAQHYQNSLEISKQDGMEYEKSQALNGFGLALYMQGDYARAQKIFIESLEIHQEIGDPWGQAIRYNNLALVAHALGQYSQAKGFYAQSLDFWKRIRQDFGMASCFNNMGLVSEALMEFSEARDLYANALTIFEQLGHQYGMASCLNNLGNVAVSLDEIEQAQERYKETLTIRENLGDQRGIASVSNNLGQVADLLGEIEVARSNYLRALEVGWESKVIPVVLDSILGLATLLIGEKSHSRVLQLLSLVNSHASSNQEAKDRASVLLESINAEYQGEEMDNLLEQVKQEPLDQVVEDFLK